MKILHILNDVTDRGNGIVHAAIDLAAGQVVRGHTVAIVSSGGGLQPLLERAGIQHLNLEHSRNPLGFIKAFAGLKHHADAFRPDIVHAHVRMGVILGWLLSKISDRPLVAHLHNIHEKESLLMGLADRVIAVSTSVASTISEQGIPQRRIRVVLNGPLGSPRMSAFSQVDPVDLTRPAIVTVCGMNHRKGIADLLTAFDQIASQITSVNLYLVGDGPDIETFKHQAQLSPYRDRIHFEGCQTIPQRYMSACDVFVLASRRESFGLALLEAREVGCAIVASNIDGIPEALDEGHAGILFKPTDTSALAEISLRLLNNSVERLALRARARSNLEKFHYLTMAKNVDSVYDELLMEVPQIEYCRESDPLLPATQSSCHTSKNHNHC